MTLIFILKGQVVPCSMYRYPSPRFKRWRDDVGKQMLKYHLPKKPLIDLCRLTMVCTHEDARARDADNLQKAVQHILEHMHIIKNDKQIVQWEGQVNLPPCRKLAGVTIKLETL